MKKLDAAHERARRVGVRPWVYRPIRALLLPILIFGFRLVRIGGDQVPADGPVIVASNHRSMLDPLVIGALTRRPVHFVAKAELFENRLIAWLLSAVGAFPVRRGRGDTQMIETALAILARGECLVIFPEGTRSRGDSLAKPKRGLGKIALDSGATVVPVAVSGTEHQPGKHRIRPRKMFVSAARPQRFQCPAEPSPRLAKSVLDRVWSQVVRQWEVLSVASAQPSAELLASATERDVVSPEPALQPPSPPREATVTGEPLSALARLEVFADTDSLRLLRTEVTSHRMGERARAGDGVFTATATIDGQPVHCFAQDLTFVGGSLGEAHAESIINTLRLAERAGTPVVGFIESAGARMQEGLAGLSGYGRMFREHVRLSGVVPQISVVSGPAAGGSSYGPALGDFVVMTKEAAMFLTGPGVVEKVTGEQVDMHSLGGHGVHEKNGVGHFTAASERSAIAIAREILGYLPNRTGGAQRIRQTWTPPIGSPGEQVPINDRKVYEVRGVIAALADAGSVLEVSPAWAPNVVCAFARIEGRPVGVIANQPRQLAGVLDVESSQKAARMVNQSNSFGLPLVVLVDTPGFMPGTEQESGGAIRHGSTLVRAFAEATVPSATVVLRKAFGGAFIAMNSKALGADYAFAWPNAQLGVMGAAQAVEIINRREIAAAEDPVKAEGELARAYAEDHLGAHSAAAEGFIDDVIEPAQTRDRLARAFSTFGR